MKKNVLHKLICFVIALTIFCIPAVNAYADDIVIAPNPELVSAPFRYEHDPRLNPTAMADAIYDPDAVYGFSPNPESTRLGSYAEYDWSDPDFVADSRQIRIEYHESMSELYDLKDAMLAEGKNIEEIARAVSALRNEIRLRAYEDNPDYLAEVKASNLATYGNEFGPTADSLYEKYGTWEMVLEKAFSSNPGMDACVGLYDELYDSYVMFGNIEEKYYSEAMQWAYSKGITDNITLSVYDAGAVCTRAEAITLIWSIFGAAETDVMTLISDCDPKAYYNDALVWAYENGIVAGTSADTFSPDKTVTRAQFTAMLSRCTDDDDSCTAENPFKDVKKSAYYYDAVIWAYDNGIVNGTSSDTFSPGKICTRGEAVTMLYRFIGK